MLGDSAKRSLSGSHGKPNSNGGKKTGRTEKRARFGKRNHSLRRREDRHMLYGVLTVFGGKVEKVQEGNGGG